MEYLNFGNEEKSTVCGRDFHTFTTLSVKKFFGDAMGDRQSTGCRFKSY